MMTQATTAQNNKKLFHGCPLVKYIPYFLTYNLPLCITRTPNYNQRKDLKKDPCITHTHFNHAN